MTAAAFEISPTSASSRVGRHRKFWRPEEDRRLANLWGEMTIRGLAQSLGRSVEAVYVRAMRLGLKAGVQPGYETLAAAAERVGYSQEALKRILAWAGADPRPGMSRLVRGRSFFKGQVDPEAVDDAVAEWLKFEIVGEAARFRGMESRLLMKWLIEAGEPKPARRCKWRVRTETIDRVIAERNARETLARAAIRVGIGRDTLGPLLRKAGLRYGCSPKGSLNPADVDRVVATIKSSTRARSEALRAFHRKDPTE